MSSFRRFLSRPFGWLIAVAGFLCLAVPLAWTTLAIYYSNLPWAGARIGLAAAFAAFAIWALWFSRQRRMSVLAAVLFLAAFPLATRTSSLSSPAGDPRPAPAALETCT